MSAVQRTFPLISNQHFPDTEHEFISSYYRWHVHKKMKLSLTVQKEFTAYQICSILLNCDWFVFNRFLTKSRIWGTVFKYKAVHVQSHKLPFCLNLNFNQFWSINSSDGVLLTPLSDSRGSSRNSNYLWADLCRTFYSLKKEHVFKPL